jgi:hypothetical protein
MSARPPYVVAGVSCHFRYVQRIDCLLDGVVNLRPQNDESKLDDIVKQILN